MRYRSAKLIWVTLLALFSMAAAHPAVAFTAGYFQNGSVSPTSGNTSTDFDYNVQLKIDPAINVIYSVQVVIDPGTAQETLKTMQQVSAYDLEWYYVDNINLPAGNHTFKFRARLVDTDTSPQTYYEVLSSVQTGPNVEAPPAPKAQYQVVITNDDDSKLSTYFKTDKDSSYQGPYSVNANGGVFSSNYVEVSPGSYSVTIKWKYPEKISEDMQTSSSQQINAGDLKKYYFTIPKYAPPSSTTTTTTSTTTTTTSTTTTTLGEAKYHLKIINNDDDNYSNVYYQLERETGGLTGEHSIAVNSGQTVITPSYAITPGSYRSVLRWTDPDKGTEDIYRDGGYVTINSGEDHEFVRYVPLVKINDPPTISIASPAAGSAVSGTVSILVEAIDPEDGALSKIEYYVDGQLKNTDSAPKPMTPTSTWNWDTTKYSNGSHTLKVIGYDSQGLTGEHQISVTVSNVVNNPPSITIASPSDGAVVLGQVNIYVSAIDPEDGALTKIEYYVDGAIKHTDNSPLPQSPSSVWQWDTFGYSFGSHTIKVIGYDSQNASAQHEISIQIKETEELYLTVKNVDGTKVPGADVLRYTTDWEYIDTQTTESDGVASWDNVETGIYAFEVYYNGEFWGNPMPLPVVAGAGFVSDVFTRYMPFVDSVTIDRSYLYEGETVQVSIEVRNKASEKHNVRVRLRLDRDQSSPYDFEELSASQNIPSGSVKTFTFTYSPSVGGNYYRSIEVQSEVNVKFIKTDFWPFTGSPLFIVSGNQSGNAEIKVKNIDHSTVSGAVVKRYSTDWTYIDSKITDVNGVAKWTDINNGEYAFEVFYNGDLWGNPSNLIVEKGKTASADFVRYMPYGESITSSSLGSDLAVDVVAKNGASYDCEVRARLILDRDQNLSYDFDQWSSPQTIKAGATGEFTFNFTPLAGESYYRSVEIETNVKNSYVRTDQWGFSPLPIGELNLTLPTAEACGYLKFSYNANDTLDEVKIYIDDQLARTDDASKFIGVRVMVELNVLAFADGEHTLKMEGWKGSSKLAELSEIFYVDNSIKFYLEKNGMETEDNLIGLKEVEQYKFVLRLPWATYTPFLDNKKEGELLYGNSFANGSKMALRTSQVGFEYERGLTAYDFEWGKDEYGGPVAWDIRAHFVSPSSPDVDSSLSMRIRTTYSEHDYSEEDMQYVSYAMKALDKTFDVIEKADSNILSIEQQQILGDGLSIQNVKIDENKYLFRTTACENMGAVTVKYELEVGRGTQVLRVIKDRSVLIFGQNEILHNIQSGEDLVAILLKGKDTRIVSKTVINPVEKINLQEAAFSSIDDSKKIVEYVKLRPNLDTEATQGFNRYLIEQGYRSGLLKDAAFAAEVANKGLYFLALVEASNSAANGDIDKALASVAAIIAGDWAAATIAPVIIEGVGATGLVAAGITVGVGTAAGVVVYYVVDNILGPPPNHLYASVVAGEDAQLKFVVLNNDDKKHDYKICLSPPTSEMVMISASSFTLDAKGFLTGFYRECTIKVATSRSNTLTGDVPVAITIIEDPLTYNRIWGELHGNIHISPWLPEMCEDGQCTVYIGNNYNSNAWIDSQTKLDNLSITNNNISVLWKNISYSINNRDFLDLNLSEGDGIFNIDILPEAETSILAVSPATITINNVSSTNMDIYHNGTLVYQDGQILDSSVIDNVYYDSLNSCLICSVNHFDSFKFVFAAADSVKPQILSLKIDGKQIVEGDYVSASPQIEVKLADDTSGISSWKLEILDELGGIKYSKSESAFSASSASSEVSANLSPDLEDGTYRVKIIVTDGASNEGSYTSPSFKVASTFNFFALAGPNPFSPNRDGVSDTTKISYQLSNNAKIKIRLVSLSGRMIRSWDYEPGVLGRSSTGYNEVEWDGKDESGDLVNNGLYLCYILAEAGGEVKKAKLQIAVLK